MASRRRLRIVSVNDVYALDNLPRLAGLVAHHRTTDPADAFLFVLAGDFLAPSLLSSIDAGRGMVDCLNLLGVTHVVLGNHEDDLPAEQLRNRLGELSAVCLGTNVLDPIGGTLVLPRDAVIRVGELRVGLVGVVMADPSVYKDELFGGARLARANDAAQARAKELLAGGCIAVVGITHQSVADDRALAAGEPKLALVVGGHEHVPMLIDVAGTWIVKAGSEAVQAVVSEIVFEGAGPPTTSVRLDAVSNYPADPALEARVALHLGRIHELTGATLLELGPDETLSSVGTRRQQTSIGTLLCSKLRDALGADACLFNGGGIRASREYRERFTYGDVEAEVPFDNEIVCVRMKGRLLREAIAASRAKAPAEAGSFLQVDDGIRMDGTTAVSVAGKALEEERTYTIAIVRELLLGLDHVEPLVRWAKEDPSVLPPAGSGREPKMVLVQAFAAAIWRRLGGFDALDADHDGRIGAAEVAEAIRIAYPQRPPSPVLVDLVIRAIDANADHVVTREEAASFTASPRRT